MHGQNLSQPEPGLAVAEVAKKLGVAPATLRTWDRRYGLAPSMRTSGAHRRYTAVDIARLELMRSHTLAGLSPGDAARIAVGIPEAQLVVTPLISSDLIVAADDIRSDIAPSERAGAGGAAGDAGGAASGDSGADADAKAQPAAKRRPALKLLPGLPPDSPALRVGDAIDAALAFDDQACLKALRFTPADDDVVVWWTQLAQPTLAALAQRVVLSPPGMAPFAIAETAALKAIGEYLKGNDLDLAAAGQPSSGHPSRLKKLVLVIADPDDTAAPAAHALAAAVVAGGAAARVVTGAVDQRRLLELVLITHPVAIVLDAAAAPDAAGGTGPAHPARDLLTALRAKHPKVEIFLRHANPNQPVDAEVATLGVHQVFAFARLVTEIGNVVA